MAYGAVRWGEENLSHIVLRRDGNVVAMAQLRILRPAPFPLALPICVGDRCSGELERHWTREAVSRMGAALEQEYVVRRKLLLQIIPQVASGSAEAAVLQVGLGQFQSDAGVSGDSERTFLLDLSAAAR